MSSSSSTNHKFYQSVAQQLGSERLLVYGQDGQDQDTILARYHLNLALSEALYPVLQTAEIALRNTIHYHLSGKEHRPDWYNSISLPAWQTQQILEAKRKLKSVNKPETPDRLIAELTFGFWASFLSSAHIKSGIAYFLSKQCFPHAQKSQRDFKNLASRWQRVRKLRNRVFHHERILHWNDLDQQHKDILQLIEWMNPDLLQATNIIDRFPTLRADGLKPWKEKLHNLL